MKQKIPGTTAQFRLLSDEELAYRYAHRSEEAAMYALYERYCHLVLGICLHYLEHADQALEMTQQIFIRLVNDLSRFEVKSFKTWLLQICRNQCLMQLRKMGKETQSMSRTAPADFSYELSETISDAQVQEAFALALNQLSQEQQTALRLFYEERKPYSDIALTTGLSPSQVKNHIQIAKGALQSQLRRLVKNIAS